MGNNCYVVFSKEESEKVYTKVFICFLFNINAVKGKQLKSQKPVWDFLSCGMLSVVYKSNSYYAMLSDHISDL